MSEAFLVLRIIEGGTTNERRSGYKAAVILLMFEGKLNFLDRLSENIQIKNFTNVRPSVRWGTSRSLGTDRLTDPTKTLVAFRHFANAPKNKMTPKVVRLQKPRDIHLLKTFPAQRRY